jgi:hypothetical protein
MRPTARTPISVPLAAAALILLPLGSVRADLILSPPTGIVVDGGTVQPVDDPFGLYTFDVLFNPAVGESIHNGNSFSVTSDLIPLIPLYLGTNGQPNGWYATFSQPVADSPENGPPEYYTVTWTYFDPGDHHPITSGGSLDPSPPFFQVASPNITPGSFTYSFSDTLTDSQGHRSSNSSNGSFDVVAVPEPSILILAASGGPVGLYLLLRARRHRIAA